MTGEKKYWHMESLRVFRMLDNGGALFGNFAWLDNTEMKCVSYDRLVHEFLSPVQLN